MREGIHILVPVVWYGANKLVLPYRTAHVDTDWYIWLIFVSIKNGIVVQTKIGSSHHTARTLGKVRAVLGGRGWRINPCDSTPL